MIDFLPPALENNANAASKRSTSKQFVALCGRIFRDADPQYFPSAEHRGRTIRLCTEACLGAFLADPELFYKVHRNSERTQPNVETR
ncbi:MAG: hypothetical protein DPW18_17630 [Chloroflexi bacterium]|nr:hypothetical protein [Chloroflexota bacterium]MDL1941010.1 hypothetical protein [Chloroflexi bacterium CFX2]